MIAVDAGCVAGEIPHESAAAIAAISAAPAAGAIERMSPPQSPEPGVPMSFLCHPEGSLIELLDRAHAVGALAALPLPAL